MHVIEDRTASLKLKTGVKNIPIVFIGLPKEARVVIVAYLTDSKHRRRKTQELTADSND